jgi:hypothetical protein
MLHYIKSHFIGTLLFIAAILVVIYTRFVALGDLPPGLHIDEASFGYEAQSLVETGKDTWGVSWPLRFKAFGEYKSPGLIYSYVPLIKIFGGHVNAMITRLPSALAGIGTLIVTLLICRLLWPKANLFFYAAALIALAFSPWHFGVSRVYYETSSALFIVSLSILQIVRIYLKQKTSTMDWILFALPIALVGYWYASFRYIGIGILLLGIILSTHMLLRKIHLIIISLLVVVVVGYGWVSELTSSVGLMRLTQVNESTQFNSQLVVDEKRQFCFLSLDHDYSKAKFCYLLWNKPVLKFHKPAITLVKFLSPELLFLKSGDEYGIDGEYGAFVLPLIIPYLVGVSLLGFAVLNALVKVVQKSAKLTSQERIQIMLLATTILGFIPALFTEETLLHRPLIGLFGLSLIILIGIKQMIDWIEVSLPKLKWLVYLFMFGALVFYSAQSQVNYFFFFTHSLDIKWEKGAPEVYLYFKEHAAEYDKLIDTAYHGPIDAGFYGGLSALDIQNGHHTEANSSGWTFLDQAGKYYRTNDSLQSLVCKQKFADKKEKILLVTDTQDKYKTIRKYAVESWTKVHTFKEIYDIDDVIKFEDGLGLNWDLKCKSEVK